MEEALSPTTMRRQFGVQLRKLRQERGLTAQQVGDALGFSVSKISRMESGARAVSETDARLLIDFFQVQGSAADVLLEVARTGRKRRDPMPGTSLVAADHARFVQSGFLELERDAELIREFNSGIVPGLLQSREYMTALMLTAMSEDSEEFRLAIDLRLRRQRRLDDRRRYRVCLDESVLCRIVGSDETMLGQMKLLLQRAQEGAVELYVLPFSRGVYEAVSSSFVIFELPQDQGVGPLAFPEVIAGSNIVDRPEDVSRFERAWAQALELSLSREASLAAIARYRDSYRSARERLLL